MPFKWLKRRRNTTAADRPPSSLPPPLPPAPRDAAAHHAQTLGQLSGRQGQTVYAPPQNNSTPCTPSSEEPKIRRRKSFFQSLRPNKDKGRRRASSFGAAAAPRFDKDAPPVPPLPNAPISAHFSTPPSRLDPDPGARKRTSLIPRKAPPSAWGREETPPVPTVPALPSLPPQTALASLASKPQPPAPAPQSLPALSNGAANGSVRPKPAPPAGTVHIDDVPNLDSPPALADHFAALDALDNLDAIGADLDLGPSFGAGPSPSALPSAPALGAPSSAFGLGGSKSKRASLPAFDKPLPSPGPTSKRLSFNPAISKLPKVDGVRPIKPAGKFALGELPQLPQLAASKPTPAPPAAPAPTGTPIASSEPLDAPSTAPIASGARLPPPPGVEMVDLPDILNHPTTGYAGARADVTSAVTGVGPGSTGSAASVVSADTEDEGKETSKDALEDADDRPRVMGGPGKVQTVFDDAEAARAPPADEPAERASAMSPGEDDRPRIMGGPGKIQDVWDSAEAARAPATEYESVVEDDHPRILGGPGKIHNVFDDAEAARFGDKESKEDQDADNDEEGNKEDQENEDDKEDKKNADDAGDTEEIADDASSVSSAQPIATDLDAHVRSGSTSTSGWASTEQLVSVNRPISSIADFAGPRPLSGVTDYSARPTSTYTDFSSPAPPSRRDSGNLLGTPSRLPSTQTFGHLPGTSTFGALPRPMSVVATVDEDAATDEEGREGLYAVDEGDLEPVVRVDVDVDAVRPSTPPPLPVLSGTPSTPPRTVPTLCTPSPTSPPSQHIHTPAITPGHPSPLTLHGASSPFKPTRSVSTPKPLTRSQTRPDSPERKKVERMPSAGNLHSRRAASNPSSGGAEEEPTLDDFMSLFRTVQKRGQGVGIRAAAAQAEGREVPRDPKPRGLGLGLPGQERPGQRVHSG